MDGRVIKGGFRLPIWFWISYLMVNLKGMLSRLS
nr:MAG TPA: hypothetical protein [Caudoviricetes sp.]